MIDSVLQYLMHIAPSLTVVIILLFWIQRQNAKMVEHMQGLLDECWDRLCDKLSEK